MGAFAVILTGIANFFYHHGIEGSLKMATSPAGSLPPPLFRSQSIQVSQQWPQPTLAAWCGSSGCVYFTNMAARTTCPCLLVHMDGLVVFFLHRVYVKALATD